MHVTMVNASPIMAELECDLRAYPSFTIELPKDNWRWAPATRHPGQRPVHAPLLCESTEEWGTSKTLSRRFAPRSSVKVLKSVVPCDYLSNPAS